MNSSLKTRITVGLVLVFLAGLATGVFGGAWHAHRAFAERHDGRMAERMRERLTKDLSLTPDQLRQMKPVLDEATKRLQEIRSDSGRRVSETLMEAHQQLGAYLTPEQQGELRKIEQRHRRGWHGGGGSARGASRGAAVTGSRLRVPAGARAWRHERRDGFTSRDRAEVSRAGNAGEPRSVSAR